MLETVFSFSLSGPADFDLSAVSVGCIKGETWDHHESSFLGQSHFSMENVLGLRVNSLPLSHPEPLNCACGLPGKFGSDMSWRSSGTGKTLQVVQLEEPYLPQARSEPACCCSSEANSWVLGGLSIQKVEHFRVLIPPVVFMALALQ